MKFPLHLTPRNAVLLATLLFASVTAIWLFQRQRRLIRADLENRGLVPSRRRHRRSSSSGKRNPTLAEVGSGLPPVRQAPPPGPVNGN